MEAIFDSVDDGYSDIPEPEHFDTLMQGVVDTHAGVESLGVSYTRAQEYLFGALGAADAIDWRAQRAGVENFITDGLGAAWDFIVKIFKSVYNAFFGSSDDAVSSKAEKAEKKVKENKEKVDSVTKTGKSEAQVETIRKKVKNKAEKIKKSPKASAADKAQAENIIKKIDEGNVKSTSQKEMDIAAFVTTIIQIDADSRENVIKATGSAEALRKKYADYIGADRSSEVGEGRFKEIYKGFMAEVKSKGIGEPINDIVKVDSIKSPIYASSVQTSLLKVIESHKHVADYIHSKKSAFDAEIKDMNEALKKKGKDSQTGHVAGEDYKSKTELNVRLKAAKTALGLINATAGFQERMLSAITHLSDTVTAVYSDYTDVKVTV